MGEVFLARDPRLERRVAVKILPAAQADDGRVRRFLQEARAAAALTHKSVAQVYDIGEQDDVRYIAMEYVEGRSLADRLRGEALPPDEVVRLGVQIAEALQAAHACGVVHRDVKPANVMVTSAGLVKVVDFGLAQLRGPGGLPGDDSIALTLTRPGMIVGTVAYMSPEQAVGAPVDHRTDLFSLGVVLFQAATGRLPFAGSTDLETMDKIRHGEPVSTVRLNAGIPAELDRIIRKCLAKKADRRYQSAQEVLIDLEALAREGEASPRDPSPDDQDCHNFPADVSSFVGRRREVDELVGLLGSTRLLTLTGSGGSGKTRLALRLGQRVAPTFAAGAWFVDLTPISDPGLVVDVVARAVGVVERAGGALRDALIEWLSPRHVLLVLDNCEHLVAHCAELAETLLRKASRLRIVATSREALGVPGESIWRVPSLALPDAAGPLLPDEAFASDAVRLFAERAAAVAQFTLTADNATTVVEICRRLDGMPLAIELAAARARILSVEQIRERLHDQFRLLTGGGRTAVARQRTLEATVDWSYELLAEEERRLLARLSIFSGGWVLEAAEQVCSGAGIDEDAVLDLLTRLVDKSLVVVEHGTQPERRYRLLETIRQYGRDRLMRSQELQSVAGRHFSYFLTLSRRAQPELSKGDQVSWLDRLDTEHDKLRAAIEWGMADPGHCLDTLSLATSLWWFWTKRDYFREGQERLTDVLAANPGVTPGAEAHALVGLMHLALFRGEMERTRELTAKCVALARESADLWAGSYALGVAAVVESNCGDFARSAALAAEAREVASRCTSPDAWMPRALSLRMLAYGALQSGELTKAGALFDEALTLCRGVGDVWAWGLTAADLAGLRVLETRHEEATALAREALVHGRSLKDRLGIGWSLQAIAMVEAAAGRAGLAASLLGAAEAALESVGAKGQVTITRVQDRYLALARDSMGEQAFRLAVEAGRAMPLERAIDMALSQQR